MDALGFFILKELQDEVFHTWRCFAHAATALQLAPSCFAQVQEYDRLASQELPNINKVGCNGLERLVLHDRFDDVQVHKMMRMNLFWPLKDTSNSSLSATDGPPRSSFITSLSSPRHQPFSAESSKHSRAQPSSRRAAVFRCLDGTGASVRQ